MACAGGRLELKTLPRASTVHGLSPIADELMSIPNGVELRCNG